METPNLVAQANEFGFPCVICELSGMLVCFLYVAVDELMHIVKFVLFIVKYSVCLSHGKFCHFLIWK